MLVNKLNNIIKLNKFNDINLVVDANQNLYFANLFSTERDYRLFITELKSNTIASIAIINKKGLKNINNIKIKLFHPATNKTIETNHGLGLTKINLNIAKELSYNLGFERSCVLVTNHICEKDVPFKLTTYYGLDKLMYAKNQDDYELSEIIVKNETNGNVASKIIEKTKLKIYYCDEQKEEVYKAINEISKEKTL